MTGTAIRFVRTLLRPATESLRGKDAVVAGLRILAGLLWLYNVSWKTPPDFGKDAGNGLFQFTSDAVEHPVLPPYSWVVEHLVLPNFQLFGWAVLAAETALAVLLLSGTAVRLAALIGVTQSVAIALSVVMTPGEWPWAYWMMIGIHVVLFATASGRVAAVDGVRAGVPGTRTRLLVGWGALALLAGAVALVWSLVEDPFASSGVRLGGSDLSVGLGSYNTLGALVLVAVGALLLAAARLGRDPLAYAGAGLAVAAAVSLYSQLGFGNVWLGGSNTSAAFLLTLAVVGAARHSPAARQLQGTSTPDPGKEPTHGAR